MKPKQAGVARQHAAIACIRATAPCMHETHWTAIIMFFNGDLPLAAKIVSQHSFLLELGASVQRWRNPMIMAHKAVYTRRRSTFGLPGGIY